jgi:DNA mismatch endonuclease (patch repair protein)
MQATRQRNTAAEVSLQVALTASGLEYCVDKNPISGIRRRADLVFEDARVAVFVDGCFWHGCPKHGTLPKTNAEWWRKKIWTNKVRDADTDHRLSKEGWAIIRVWEHEDPRVAATRIVDIVRMAWKRLESR